MAGERVKLDVKPRETSGSAESRRLRAGGFVPGVFDGQKTAHHAVLKEYQLDPTRARLLHIDLHEVRLDQAIHAQVVVELTGESEGVKEGGVLTQVSREVNVEALPMEVPDRLELDISAMAIGDSLRVSDLRAPEGVTLLDDPETVLATVTPPTKVELPQRHGGSFRSKFSGDLAEVRIEGRKAALLKPQTYMNESGRSVGAAARFFKLPAEQLLVLHD